MVTQGSLTFTAKKHHMFYLRGIDKKIRCLQLCYGIEYRDFTSRLFTPSIFRTSRDEINRVHFHGLGCLAGNLPNLLRKDLSSMSLTTSCLRLCVGSIETMLLNRFS